MAMEQVVPQHQGGWCTREKVSADQRLGQTIRAGLHGVLDSHAPGTAITQQLKGIVIIGRCDQQHLTDTRRHRVVSR